MKKYALAICAALPLLGACTPTSTSSTVKTIGEVAGNSLPVACTVWAVAKGYFTNVLSVNSASNITIGNAAIATFNSICPPNPPPTDIATALTDLNTAWVALEAATTVPVVKPTPAPTMPNSN